MLFPPPLEQVVEVLQRKRSSNTTRHYSTVPDIDPEYRRGLANIESDILPNTEYAGIITTGVKGFSEFESESI